jgi:hypothetical protein
MATQTVEEMAAGLFHDVAIPTIHIGMARAVSPPEPAPLRNWS